MENSGVRLSVSDVAMLLVRHKDNHPAAARYGDETQPTWLLPPPSELLSTALGDQSSGLQFGAWVISPLSSG